MTSVDQLRNFTYVPPSYSLGAQCGSEAVAMTWVIFVGESILANELLAKTKGHEMGWGAVALGFAFAFATAIMGLGYISAVVNPAMLLALWVTGEISVQQFFALSACEVAGAFVGAVLVWLQYLPHFKTVPEPAPLHPEEDLLRTRDYIGHTGLHILGNKVWVKQPQRDILQDIPYFLNIQDKFHMPVNELVDNLLGLKPSKSVSARTRSRQSTQENGADEVAPRLPSLYRRSVQVADLQRRLKKIDDALHEHKSTLSADMVGTASQAEEGRARPQQTTEPARQHSIAKSTAAKLKKAFKLRAKPVVSYRIPGKALRHMQKYIRKHEAQDNYSRAEYEAALLADQHAKLSIFATRPQIVTPVFNFLAEFMGTTMLVLSALMLAERGEMVYATASFLYPLLESMYIGFLIFLLILGLGGPTGYAANPARDFGPRLAHFLLPIPNKGPSEWRYALIPIVAPFLGGLAGGGLYVAINSMNRSNVESPMPMVVYRLARGGG